MVYCSFAFEKGKQTMAFINVLLDLYIYCSLFTGAAGSSIFLLGLLRNEEDLLASGVKMITRCWAFPALVWNLFDSGALDNVPWKTIPGIFKNNLRSALSAFLPKKS